MSKQTDIDRRYCFQSQAIATLEKRADDDNSPPRIAGYGAVFFDENDPDTEFDVFNDGSFLERIMPGAFDRAIREDDVRGLFNHDANQILGRNTAGTMELSVDSVGLLYRIDPPETPLGEQVSVSIQRGDVTGSSFSFRFEEQTLREVDDGVLIREILGVRLFDVGPVVFPAYPATTAQLSERSLESLEEFRQSLREAGTRRLDMAKRRLLIR